MCWSQVNCPQLFMPAGNDGPSVKVLISGFMKLTKLNCIKWSWRAKFYWRHKHLDSFIQAGGLAEQVLGSKLEVCKCCNSFLNMDSDCLLTCPQIVEFPEMSHGWLPRGDMSKPEVSRDVKKTMENLFAFFGKNLWLKMFFFCTTINIF